MTSPEGKTFSPKWRGDPRTFAKKLGVHEYPLVDGDVVQDLRTSSNRYTFTVHFDGENHDIRIRTIFSKLVESGAPGRWSTLFTVLLSSNLYR
jgi:prophage DNA circulation protein